MRCQKAVNLFTLLIYFSLFFLKKKLFLSLVNNNNNNNYMALELFINSLLVKKIINKGRKSLKYLISYSSFYVLTDTVIKVDIVNIPA